MWKNNCSRKTLDVRNVSKRQQKLKAMHFWRMLTNIRNTRLLYYACANHFIDVLYNVKRTPNVKTTSVCLSGCRWPSIRDWTIFQIFMKFSVQILLIKFVKQACVSYKSAQWRDTLHKGMNGMLPIFLYIFYTIWMKFGTGYLHKICWATASIMKISAMSATLYLGMLIFFHVLSTFIISFEWNFVQGIWK
jgi:hypothetical protein